MRGTTLSATARVEQAAGFSGQGIAFGEIGKGEDVGGEKDGRSRLGVARRLCEAVVEAAPACSGDMGENAIEGDAAVLVRVEALVDEVAQKQAVLRDAFAVDALQPE